MNEINELDNLEYVKVDNEFTEEEMNKFDGTRAKVAEVLVHDFDSKYAIEDTKLDSGNVIKAGKPLPEGITVKAKEVVVKTEPVKTNAMGQPVAVTARFQLKKHKVKGTWVASLHEKSNTFKFFKKYGVNSFPEIKGKEVILSKKVSKDRVYLGISLG